MLLDDLEKAKNKLKVAENTSDVQTDLEEKSCSQKRQIRIPRKLWSSEDENDDDDISKHCAPPPIKKKTLEVFQKDNARGNKIVIIFFMVYLIFKN